VGFARWALILNMGETRWAIRFLDKKTVSFLKLFHSHTGLDIADPTVRKNRAINRKERGEKDLPSVLWRGPSLSIWEENRSD